MNKQISPMAVALTAVLGCVLSGVGLFALFMAAMGERWWPAVTFAALAAVVSFPVGFFSGRRGRASGWAGVAALMAPSLLLALFFLADALTGFLSGPVEPGIPVAGPAFLGLSLLFGMTAAVGVMRAAPMVAPPAPAETPAR